MQTYVQLPQIQGAYTFDADLEQIALVLPGPPVQNYALNPSFEQFQEDSGREITVWTDRVFGAACLEKYDELLSYNGALNGWGRIAVWAKGTPGTLLRFQHFPNGVQSLLVDYALTEDWQYYTAVGTNPLISPYNLTGPAHLDGLILTRGDDEWLFFDGDSDHAVWSGVPYQSPSIQEARTPGWGRVVWLPLPGIVVTGLTGATAGPTDATAWAATRPITLGISLQGDVATMRQARATLAQIIGQMADSTSYGGLIYRRRATVDGPWLPWVYIPARYIGGIDALSETQNNTAISFEAQRTAWRHIAADGVELATAQTLAASRLYRTNLITGEVDVLVDPGGAPQQIILDPQNGNVYVRLTTTIKRYQPQPDGSYYVQTIATANGTIRCINLIDGVLYAAGDFTQLQGDNLTTGSSVMWFDGGDWNHLDSYTSLTPTYWIGAAPFGTRIITTASGVLIEAISGADWYGLTGVATEGTVTRTVLGPDQSLVLIAPRVWRAVPFGNPYSADTIIGWLAWESIGRPTGGTATAAVVDAEGTVYVGGTFSGWNYVDASNVVTSIDGAQGGIVYDDDVQPWSLARVQGSQNSQITSLLDTPHGILAIGQLDTLGVEWERSGTSLYGLGRWNGIRWEPLGIDRGAAGSGVLGGTAETVIVGWSSNVTHPAAAATTIDYDYSAPSYPRITLLIGDDWTPGDDSTVLIRNVATQQTLVIAPGDAQPGETLTIVCDPEAPRMWSSLRRDVSRLFAVDAPLSEFSLAPMSDNSMLCYAPPNIDVLLTWHPTAISLEELL